MLGATTCSARRLPGLLSDDDVPHLLSWPRPQARAPRNGRRPQAGKAGLHATTATWRKDCWPGSSPCGTPRCCHQPGRALAARCLQNAGPAHSCQRSTDRGRRRGTNERVAAAPAAPWPSACSATKATVLRPTGLIWAGKPPQAAQERDAENSPRRRASLPAVTAGVARADGPALGAGEAAGAGPEKAPRGPRCCAASWDPQDRTRRTQPGRPKIRRCGRLLRQLRAGRPRLHAQAVQAAASSTPRGRAVGWAGAATHAARVLDCTSAPPSDATASQASSTPWHVDPGDGRIPPVADNDLATRPGITLLPPGLGNSTSARPAWHYLHRGTARPGHTRHPGQLPLTPWPDTWPCFLSAAGRPAARALAGTMPCSARWAPSVLVTGTGADGPRGPNPKEVLLERLAGSAPAGLPGSPSGSSRATWHPDWPSAWSRSTLLQLRPGATLTSCLGSAAAALAAFFAARQRGAGPASAACPAAA